MLFIIFKRVCKICNLAKVEDEQHFIMECPAYELERNALFDMANLNIEMINMDNICVDCARHNLRRKNPKIIGQYHMISDIVNNEIRFSSHT